MRVLHICEYAKGGVATYLNTIFSRDGEQGIDNYMVLSYYKSEHMWNLSQEKVQYYNYRRSVWSLFPAILKINRCIKKLNPDVIYCHSTWAGLLGRFPYLFCRKRIKIIYNAHGWSFNMNILGWKKHIYASIERILATVTDKIINVSKYELNSAVNSGLPRNKMAMIYNGISAEKTTVNEKAEMCTDKINLLFVGRFDPQKGVDFLLKVFDEHADELKHIHLWVVGDSVVSDGEGIEKKKLDNITFLGWIPHDKLPAYYEACDAVIMPSRWEAFGLVAIEAMKYGKPIIASKRGALPELVKDDVNGWTFEMDNEYSLLGILSGLDKLSVNIAGRDGERIFLDRFTDVRMLEKFNDILGGVFVDRKENTGRTASWHR